MTWVVYKNSSDALQVFIGILLIASILFIACANIYYSIKDWIENRKKS